MKIVIVVGARPQFVKAAVLVRAVRQAGAAPPVLVHTGQHYDDRMSQVFFDDLELPRADVHLGISGGSHGEMTGRMMQSLEAAMQRLEPDWVVVLGDTNSTLAAALVAAKLHQRVAHVEAGLRSFNRRMPEEVNRIVADQLSDVLFAPTSTAMDNLATEGIRHPRAIMTGDVMQDAFLHYRQRCPSHDDLVNRLGLPSGPFVLSTVHRQENTDSREKLDGILKGLRSLSGSIPVVLPVHPRTAKRAAEFGIDLSRTGGFVPIEPVGYLDMVRLLADASLVITDSGGLQKEAYMSQTSCVTVRPETEWVELLETGATVLCEPTEDAIVRSSRDLIDVAPPSGSLYGDGHAGDAIIGHLLEGDVHGK
ncbi:MAG: UDP-N-acetylglucosamine 2-epimerase (non-hydrolyzing) [Actinomycetota bacterium]